MTMRSKMEFLTMVLMDFLLELNVAGAVVRVPASVEDVVSDEVHRTGIVTFVTCRTIFGVHAVF